MPYYKAYFDRANAQRLERIAADHRVLIDGTHKVPIGDKAIIGFSANTAPHAKHDSKLRRPDLGRTRRASRNPLYHVSTIDPPATAHDVLRATYVQDVNLLLFCFLMGWGCIRLYKHPA